MLLCGGAIVGIDPPGGFQRSAHPFVLFDKIATEKFSVVACVADAVDLVLLPGLMTRSTQSVLLKSHKSSQEAFTISPPLFYFQP